jgi:flagellar assembly protein FliH
MSEIIPKEKQASFQRWQIGSFEKSQPVVVQPNTSEPPREVREPVPQISLPTAEELGLIYEEAHANGYQAGYDEGKLAAEATCHEATDKEAQRFLQLTNGMRKALDELDQHIAEQLLDLATEIAAQVIRSSISVKNDLLLPIIREAITALPLHHAHLTLRLNPEDATRIHTLIGEQLAQQGTQIIEDSEVSPGGCQVRAGTSEVDASIETRWKRVIEAIGAEPQAWLNP